MDVFSYAWRLARTIWRAHPRHTARVPAWRPPLLLAVLLSLAGWTFYSSATLPDPEQTELNRLGERMELVSRHLERVEAVYDTDISHLERVLRGQGADERMARRVAVALHAEALRLRIEPRLLLGVMLVENPWIDPAARSPVGAQGLMQVMPFHRGRWPCEPRLDDIEANICHGAHIFADLLQRERGNVERALLRYNGCVRGTNTPNCHTYPLYVFARTGGVTIYDWRNGLTGEMGGTDRGSAP
jgi:hypothetical protein